MAENQNKKYNIDKTLTMRKSGSGEKVFSHVGGKTHALEHHAISKEEECNVSRERGEADIDQEEAKAGIDLLFLARYSNQTIDKKEST